MKTKKKKRAIADSVIASLPPGFRRLEIAIPDEAWDTYCRYAKRTGVEPGDIVTSILGVGFQRLRMFEMVAEEDRNASATRH